MKGGFPRLYWTFMRNVYDAGLSDMITPLVQQTVHAARICAARNVRADLIYVDGDHGFEGCRRDLAAFAPLLAEPGVIPCDDYQWEGARRAIDGFVVETGADHLVVGKKVVVSPRRDIMNLKERLALMLEKQRAFRERAAAEAVAT